MKRLLSVILTLILLVSVTACEPVQISISPEDAEQLSKSIDELIEKANNSEETSGNAKTSDTEETTKAGETAIAGYVAGIAENAEAINSLRIPAYRPDSEESIKINEAVLSYFYEICKIPHPPTKEKALSDYMKALAEERGYQVVQDNRNNLVFTVPATSGYENAPVIALQGHLDMVCVAEDGFAYDPEKDPIKPVRDGNILRADHTSLGADDGIGLSIILYLIDNLKEHGTIKVFMTTDEEGGVSGASGLDPQFMNDVDYLFNVDSDISNIICISSASCISIKAEKTPKTQKPDYDNPVELRIEGGIGGHSAIDIESGHINAIVVLNNLLMELEKQGIPYELAKMTGGSADNVIPGRAGVLLMTDSRDYEKIESITNAFMEWLLETYGKTDPKVSCFIGVTDSYVPKVLTKQETQDLITYCLNGVSGVYAYSSKWEKLVAGSGNMAIVSATPEKIAIVSSVRASEQAPEEHLLNAYTGLARSLGYEISCGKSCPAWPIDENNTLASTAYRVYEAMTGTSPILAPTHGATEAGNFHEMNPNTKIISVGSDLENVHSVMETLQIDSISKTVLLIENTMQVLYRINSK